MTRGFSLVEMMTVLGVAGLMMAGALSVGVQLQKMGSFEEQTMETQALARAVKDAISDDLLGAGAGLGNARINLGGTTFAYAVNVTTDAPFAADGTFALPSGAYAGLPSDAVEFFAGDTANAVALGVNGVTGNYRGPTPPYTSTLDRAPPASWVNGTRLLFVRADLQTACMETVSAVGPLEVTSSASLAAADDGCVLPATANAANVWRPTATSVAYAMTARAVAYRVNWKSGAPVLEVDADGRAGPAVYQELSRNVERIKLRLGLANLTDPTQPLVWIPDATATPARTLAVDACTDPTNLVQCDADLALVGGYSAADLPAGDVNRVHNALMRRVRSVELNVAARSSRIDIDAVKPSGVTFYTDPEGNLYDGYKRRRLTFRSTPRNLNVAGVMN